MSEDASTWVQQFLAQAVTVVALRAEIAALKAGAATPPPPPAPKALPANALKWSK